MNIDVNSNEKGKISNVSDDLWYDGVTTPYAEKLLSPFGIVSSWSFTAPPTPSSSVYWKGG